MISSAEPSATSSSGVEPGIRGETCVAAPGGSNTAGGRPYRRVVMAGAIAGLRGRAKPTDNPEQMRHKAAMLADSIQTSPPAPTLADARATLERVWGHGDFRGLQADVVAEILAGRDVL